MRGILEAINKVFESEKPKPCIVHNLNRLTKVHDFVLLTPAINEGSGWVWRVRYTQTNQEGLLDVSGVLFRSALIKWVTNTSPENTKVRNVHCYGVQRINARGVFVHDWTFTQL